MIHKRTSALITVLVASSYYTSPVSCIIRQDNDNIFSISVKNNLHRTLDLQIITRALIQGKWCFIDDDINYTPRLSDNMYTPGGFTVKSQGSYYKQYTLSKEYYKKMIKDFYGEKSKKVAIKFVIVEQEDPYKSLFNSKSYVIELP